jgi:hypothetical protein
VEGFGFRASCSLSLRPSLLWLIAGTLLLSDILADLSGKPLEDTVLKSLASFYSARLVSSDSFYKLIFFTGIWVGYESAISYFPQKPM